MGEASQLIETRQRQRRDEVAMGDEEDSGVPMISKLNEGVDEDDEEEGGESEATCQRLRRRRPHAHARPAQGRVARERGREVYGVA
uniref:Uncharacterized protein n=1 Tax=Oryza punctata TaxID=4537 RepID=A0A0E0M283_ORYPU